MDSELTLVSLAPPTPYFLSSTDLTNAVIFASPGEPLYRITSDAKYVKICRGPVLIAVLRHRDILSDTIFFPQRHRSGGTRRGTETRMSFHRWFKRSRMSDGTSTFTVDTEYGPYVWKTASRYRIQVFAGYDLENPVASCYLQQYLPTGNPALILESAGEPLRDDIVVAYVIQRYRAGMENMTVDLFVGSS